LFEGVQLLPNCSAVALPGWANAHELYKFVYVGGPTPGSLASCPAGTLVSGWKFSLCNAGSNYALLLALRCKPAPSLLNTTAVATNHVGACVSTSTWAAPNVNYDHSNMANLGTVRCPASSSLVSLGIQSCFDSKALQWSFQCAPLLRTNAFTESAATGVCDITGSWGRWFTRALQRSSGAESLARR